MTKYIASQIEPKWQEAWKDKKIFSPSLSLSQKPYYALMMFPYPSAEGLHVGNMYPFTAVDILARYQRMQGYNVFEPIGLDGFGIHSENYALKINKNPAELSAITSNRFYKQLEMVGNSFDWTKTLETYDPEYYRWTQWIFLKLYKAGLAVQKEASVNWCPSCLTVLADEQVIGGKCERCGSEVKQKQLKQWFFKITNYADRLLNNLEKLDWSERIKVSQRNWIGRSEGTTIKFGNIEVFTTRADTVFGATFIILSPEHPLVDQLTAAEYRREVTQYIEQARQKTELERKETKEKTGVFTGSLVTNPFTDTKIPVWIADYVLTGYGTGAIMAVPAHDQRDFEFAKKYNLPVRHVIEPEKLRAAQGSGKPEHRHNQDNSAYEGEGILVNSGKFSGTKSSIARSKISEYIEKQNIGSRQVQYHLRDWLISRQRYWGPPIPIIYCEKCGTQPVPEVNLPVLLPQLDNFRPTGTGKSPLASVAEFVNTECPVCGREAKRETDVSDNFLDSAWYFLRYPSVSAKDRAFDPEITDKWLPVDIYIGGFEHANLHLMYSRFITMALFDIGLIKFEEPFKKFIANGHILSNGAKMSKSKGNVINPDDYIREYGADTFRTYLMFLAPITQGGDFRTEAINGIYRFLEKIWNLTQSLDRKQASKPELAILHKTIKGVTADIESGIRLNTAIAKLMELLNFLQKQKRASQETLETLLKLLAPFAPHITEELWHKITGGDPGSIHLSSWPKFDEKYLTEDTVTLAIQINGKFRGTINIPQEHIKNKDYVETIVWRQEIVQKYAKDPEAASVVYVPGKVFSISTQNTKLAKTKFE